MKHLFKYIKYLQLQKPVVIRLLTKPYKKADAEYRPRYNDKSKLKSHDVWVYLNGNTRSFKTLLAHELIHAWQAENNKTEIHGKYFRKLAKKMQKRFKLHNIYIPNIDT